MKTLLSILFIAFSNSIFAQIYATNKTDEPIWVATVTYQKNGSFSGYVSNGWYKIIPGERINCGGKLRDGDNTYYIHAHNESGSKWGSEKYFAVDKVNAFTIQNCDMEYVLSHPNYKLVGFTKKFVHIGFFDLYETEVTFSE
jgi:hypothetical protein